MDQADALPVNESIRIREATLEDAAAWGAMRCALWPGETGVDDVEEMNDALERGGGAAAFLAFDDRGSAIGFAEATVRREYVNGTDTSPVGFLEGWFVRPEWRGRGIGRALVESVEDWTRMRGCRELASDTWLDSTDSQQAHRHCGFEETERIVFFRKWLT